MAHASAIIFDFDGVIADSLSSLYHVYCELLLSFGKTGDQDEFASLNGAKASEIASRLKRRHQIKASVQEIEDAFHNAVAKLPEHMQPMAGAQDVLNALLYLKIPLALATSSSKSYFGPFLQRHKLRPYFNTIVSGQEVAQAKPDPAIYKLAMSRLQSRGAWVVEDAQAGVIAAKAAGARPILLASPWEPKSTADMADRSIQDLHELIPLLIDHNTETCQILTLSRSIQVEQIDEPYMLDMPEPAIKRQWRMALQEKASLFDSQISVYHSHTWRNGMLTVQIQPGRYRDFYVARRLGVDYPALGVSGVIQDTSGRVLFGLRARECTEYPEHWECAPAGGLPYQHQTWQEALVDEVVEETSLQRQDIITVQPIGLFKDCNHGVFDIAASLQVSDTTTVKAGNEYLQLRAERPATALQECAPWVPLSQTLMQVLNWVQMREV